MTATVRLAKAARDRHARLNGFTVVDDGLLVPTPDASGGETGLKKAWQREFDGVCRSLKAGWFVAKLWDGHDGDWFEYLRPSTPAGLARVHQGLVSVGYANGWL